MSICAVLTLVPRPHPLWVDHAYALLAERDPQLTVLDVTELDPVETHLAIHAALRQISQTGDIDLSPGVRGTTEPPGPSPTLATPDHVHPRRAETESPKR